MTVEQLRVKLDYVDSGRENRLKNAQLIFEHHHLIPDLLKIALDENDAQSHKAAWILEFACLRNINVLGPHYDYFTPHLDQPTNGSTIRPIAKICELIIENHFHSKNNKNFSSLKYRHLEYITEFCFDLLIGKENDNNLIAPKVYAMSTLLNLGKQFTWIIPELKSVLERDYPNQSKGYQARARKVLRHIKKFEE